MHRSESSDLQVDAEPYERSGARVLPDPLVPQNMAANPSEADIVIHPEEYPAEFTEDQYDVLLVYAKADEVACLKVKEILQQFITLGDGTNPKICDMGKGTNLSWVGGQFDHFREALERSTFTFIYMSVNLVNDAWADMTKDECLMESINNPKKRWCVVPLFPKKKKTLVEEGLKIPFGLNALKGASLSDMLKRGGSFMDVDVESLRKSDFDQYFLSNMADMLTRRLHLKLERQRKNAADLEDWLKDERRKRLHALRTRQLQQELRAQAAEEEWQCTEEALRQAHISQQYNVVETNPNATHSNRGYTPPTDPLPADFLGNSSGVAPLVGHQGDTHIHYHINDASQLPPAQQITYNLSNVHQAQIGTGNVISTQSKDDAELEMDGEDDRVTEATVVMETDTSEAAARANEDNSAPLVCEVPSTEPNRRDDLPTNSLPQDPVHRISSTASCGTLSVDRGSAGSRRDSGEDSRFSAGSTRDSEGDIRFSAGSTRDSGEDSRFSARSSRDSEGDIRFSAGSSRNSEEDVRLSAGSTRDSEGDVRFSAGSTRETSDVILGAGSMTEELSTRFSAESRKDCTRTMCPSSLIAAEIGLSEGSTNPKTLHPATTSTSESTPASVSDSVTRDNSKTQSRLDSSPVISSNTTTSGSDRTCTSRPVAVVSPIVSDPTASNSQSVSEELPFVSTMSLSTNTSDSFHVSFHEDLNPPYPYVHTEVHPEQLAVPRHFLPYNPEDSVSELTSHGSDIQSCPNDDDDDVTLAKQRMTDVVQGRDEDDSEDSSVLPRGIEEQCRVDPEDCGSEVVEGQSQVGEVGDVMAVAHQAGQSTDSSGDAITEPHGQMTEGDQPSGQVMDNDGEPGQITNNDGASSQMTVNDGPSGQMMDNDGTSGQMMDNDGQATNQSHSESTSRSSEGHLDSGSRVLDSGIQAGEPSALSLDLTCAVTNVEDTTDESPDLDSVEEGVDTLSSDAFGSVGAGQQMELVQGGAENAEAGPHRQNGRQPKKDRCTIQ